jgi:gustatory receptor
MSSEIYKGYLRHEHCNPHDDFLPVAKAIYIEQRSHLFRIIGFHYLYIPIFELVHIAKRVAWTFTEVLIISMALNLSMKFKQFYAKLDRVKDQVMWSSYWSLMREHYRILCELLEMANDFIAPLLIIVTFTDFFFLCERLYKQYA